ncbi:hypothetical protein C3L33_04769, partial [Rhododendron williamsianum]
MPFITEAASAIKNRLGFQDQSSESSMPSVRSSPDLLFKSASAVRIAGERDENGEGTVNRSFELSEDPSFWKDHNVQVIIRIRPLSSAEISVQGYNRCVRQDSCQTITWTGHPESRFTFDLVADENVSQEMLFKLAGVPMVENCMGGYNSCMFAYGQTGSGKTHTMLGDIEGGTGRHSVNCGMTPRVFEYLFSSIQKEKEARREEKLKFTCKCSFLEIYNEHILDLLDPSSTNLQIREDTKKGVYVDNLTEVEVSRARDVIQQLVQFLPYNEMKSDALEDLQHLDLAGAANRKVAATNMNHASSRSHSVFTCIIESKWESQGVTHHRFARLNLVDLAGSERQKSSGAEGERLKEATNINKSLSTLGLVIMNLVNMSNGKSLHVPYRDSKLTFLLQKEVSRLRGLANGEVENHESDALTVSFPGSPGSFKWEGLHGSLSPLISDKRVSQKKEYEVALIGAFRREKDKDTALQALAAQHQAAMQLAKQREDEIQGLKMRLRFRESGIKRLEAVASGKISAETHLLKEKEEHLKEIEVLRSQLLEALDWKLMHESEPSIIQKGNSNMATEMHGDGNLLVSSQGAGSPWRLNDENEFLCMQAIQNQSEIDMLRKKLGFCLEEKDNLERNVNDLVTKLEAEKSSEPQEDDTQRLQFELPNIAPNDHIELQTMVDAIAGASQREAEAHETAIILAKENEELRMKLKVLIEDNNKLIELYEHAVSERADKGMDEVQNSQEYKEDHCNHFGEFAEEKELGGKREVENLEHQLMEMHEENEKLLALYEKAMQERDEFKRMLSSGGQNIVETKGEFSCPEKLVEVDGGGTLELEKTNTSDEGEMQETDFPNLDAQDGSHPCNEDPQEDTENDLMDVEDDSDSEKKSLEINMTKVSEDLGLVRMKLDIAQEKLLNSAETLSSFVSLEKAIAEVDDLSKEIEVIENAIQMKQQEYASLKLISCDTHERRDLIDRKLMALKYSLSSFSSSVGYFEQREVQTRERFNASLSYLDRKKEELACLQSRKNEIEDAKKKFQQLEDELTNNIAHLNSKIEEENLKRENEKVLFAIDNLEKTDVIQSQRNWHLSGKATELLKSEEEKTKAQIEMIQAREKLGIMRKESEDLNRKFKKVESEMQVVETEVQKGLKSVEEMEHKLQTVVQEKEMVLEMKENGSSEAENMILEYHQRTFEADLKEEEVKILDEELQRELDRVTKLQKAKAEANEKKSQLLGFVRCESCLEEIQDIRMSIQELKSLLLGT